MPVVDGADDEPPGAAGKHTATPTPSPERRESRIIRPDDVQKGMDEFVFEEFGFHSLYCTTAPSVRIHSLL